MTGEWGDDMVDIDRDDDTSTRVKQEIIPPSTALVLLDDKVQTPAVIFSEGGSKGVLDQLTALVDTLDMDASTEAKREALNKFEYKLARTKTAVDAMGEKLKQEAQNIVNATNKERKLIWNGIEALQTRVYAPVKEHKDREAKRVMTHEAAIKSLELQAEWRDMPEPDAEAIRKRIEQVALISLEGWDEFTARAKATKETVLRSLGLKLDRQERQEVEQAELARLRAEEDERVKVWHGLYSDAVLENVAFDARKAAEAKAARDAQELADKTARDKAAAEKKAQDDAAAAAKALQDAEDKRLADLKAAAEKAESDKAAALQKQKDDAAAAQKVIDDAAAEQARQDKIRADNLEHKKKINNEVMDGIKKAMDIVGQTDKDAPYKALIIAIVEGKVPHVSIKY